VNPYLVNPYAFGNVLRGEIDDVRVEVMTIALRGGIVVYVLLLSSDEPDPGWWAVGEVRGVARSDIGWFRVESTA
jgi:hypothetical protein